MLLDIKATKIHFLYSKTYKISFKIRMESYLLHQKRPL